MLLLLLVHRLGLAVAVAVAVLRSGGEQLAVAIMRAKRAKGRRGAHLCRATTARARACACVHACMRAGPWWGWRGLGGEVVVRVGWAWERQRTASSAAKALANQSARFQGYRAAGRRACVCSACAV